MNTELITLYHGTGAGSAADIVSNGFRSDYLQSIGAIEVAREIAHSVLGYLNLSPASAWEIDRALSARMDADAVGEAERDLWVRSLPYVTGVASEGKFDYGAFFVTTSITRAYRYTLGNPYRSEFIRSLAGGCAICLGLGPELTERYEELRRSHPVCFSVIEARPDPVVLEIKGVPTCDLQAEDGAADIEGDLEHIRLFTELGEDPQISFRVKRLQRRNIVAVHALAEWDPAVKPTGALVQSVRFDPEEWIAARFRK